MGCKMEALSRTCQSIEYRRFTVLRTHDGKYVVGHGGQQFTFNSFDKVKEWVDWVYEREGGRDD